MFAQQVPDLELANKIIADKRPRSVGRAKKLLAMNGFQFDCEGFFLAGEPRGCHMYEICQTRFRRRGSASRERTDMRDYYQEMRDACAEIVKTTAKACSEDSHCLGYIDFDELLNMAKWVAMDRDEAMEACKEALEKAMKEGVAEAMLKAIEKDLAQA